MSRYALALSVGPVLIETERVCPGFWLAYQPEWDQGMPIVEGEDEAAAIEQIRQRLEDETP